jgi:hypothetical protein
LFYSGSERTGPNRNSPSVENLQPGKRSRLGENPGYEAESGGDKVRKASDSTKESALDLTSWNFQSWI